MNKSKFLSAFSILLFLFCLAGCNDNSKKILNAVPDSKNYDGTSIPSSVNYNSSILDGETDVEVNVPVAVTFNQNIDPASVTADSSYLADSTGKVLPSRTSCNENTITLFPRIRLQPGRTHTVVIKSIQTTSGETVEDIVITYTNRDLDFGLYWYGKYGLCEKYFPGVENAFYSSEKPSVIFSHGHQGGLTEQDDSYGRKGFNYETFLFKEDNFSSASGYNGLSVYVNHSWIDAGWNTAFVYWTQFADETNLVNGEAKIWTFNGPAGSRYIYLTQDGKIEYREWDKQLVINGQAVEAESVSHIFGLYLVEALKGNTSGNIRLVGHSLGAQVVSKLSKYCFENNVVIKRLAILDPAWTNGEKDFLGDLNGDGKNDWTGERCKQLIFDMMKMQGNKFAVEIYHTTGINLGVPVVDDNAPLTKKICDVNVMPWYYGTTQLEQKHVAVRFHYFWSFESPPPVECIVRWWKRVKTGNCGPSAATPSERIVEMMTEDYEWTQVEGRYTPDPSDDWYERKKKKSGLFGSVF